MLGTSAWNLPARRPMPSENTRIKICGVRCKVHKYSLSDQTMATIVCAPQHTTNTS
jgi:hypothetical protein